MKDERTFEAHGQTWTKHAPGDPMPKNIRYPIGIIDKGGSRFICSDLSDCEPELWSAEYFNPIIGWRYADHPQEPDELATLRIKLEDAETIIEDIASDVAEFAADGESPNAGPRDRLAAKVFSHISAHRASAQDSKLSWKDKQIAGLEESLRAAKERMLTNDAELATLRAVVSACMRAMPCGNIATHTPENLADRISDLAQSLATESLENDTLREENAELRAEMQHLIRLIELTFSSGRGNHG